MALFEKARTFSKCEIQRRVNGTHTDREYYPSKNKHEKKGGKFSLYMITIEEEREEEKTSFSISIALAGRSQEIVIIIKWFLVLIFCCFVSSRRARAGQQTIPLVIINNILSFFSPLF